MAKISVLPKPAAWITQLFVQLIANVGSTGTIVVGNNLEVYNDV
jgi:hypothetical protein